MLERQLSQKESEKEQKNVIIISSVIFTASFLLCGFDFRWDLTEVPLALSIVGCLIFILTYFGFAELLRENAYLSRTIEVQE